MTITSSGKTPRKKKKKLKRSIDKFEVSKDALELIPIHLLVIRIKLIPIIIGSTKVSNSKLLYACVNRK